jgi:hypothetical protein
LWDAVRDALDDKSQFLDFYEPLYRRFASREEPWMDCFSCNISVTKSERIEFDETFTNWGCEDYDLFYGLYSEHGYEVRTADTMAYEIEGNIAAASQARIIGHLRNGFRFYDKWSHTGLRPEYAVPLYRFNAETRLWRVGNLPGHGWKSAYQDGYVDMARRWLADNGYYVTEGGHVGSEPD